MIEGECILQSKDQFGESPVWSVAEQILYWVDIKASAVKSLDPVTQAHKVWPLPDEVGSIALRAVGGLVAATTLDDQIFAAVGKLFKFEIDHLPRVMASDFVLLNGIAWSPDNKTMYVADSRHEMVYAYDFDISEGLIANRRAYISTDNVPGRVDGATVAQDGTHVRGGQVAQYDPDGDLLQTIRLPVRYPLMCAFGGPDLDILYVTSSLAMVTKDEAEHRRLLFAIQGCGSRGITEVGYAG
jgi:sugar lactone lactonase YvrE